MHGKGKRGITLVEVIVVAVLMSILFYYIYKLMAPGLRVWRQSDVKVKLQQNNLVAMHRMMNELRESNRNSVTLCAYDVAIYRVSTLICFASARDNTGKMITTTADDGKGKTYDTGEPSWQKYIIYYLDRDARLRRVGFIDYAGNKEPSGMHILGDPISRVKVTDLGTDRVVARNIEKLTIEKISRTALWEGWLRIVITALDNSQSDMKDYRTSLETTVEVAYDKEEK